MTQTPDIRKAPDNLELSRQALNAHLGEYMQVVPEAEAKRELIEQGAGILIDTFEVTPEFFEDGNKSDIFISLALNAGEIEEQKRQSPEGPVDPELERRGNFVASMAFLLLDEHSGTNQERYDKLHEDQSEGFGPDSENVGREVLERFTDKQLTEDLTKLVVEERLLDDVREGLGLPEDEPLTDIRVLSIGKNAGGNLAREPNGVTIEEIWDWERGMRRRSDAFAKLLPRGGLIANIAAGFNARDGDTSRIFMPQNGATQLLAARYGIELQNPAVLERVTTTLKHEYVHSKKPVDVGNMLGLTIEERRAEYQSGDKGEYFDEKKFLTHLAIVYGTHITQMFDEISSNRREGQETSIYQLLAREYGIGIVADITAALPQVYANSTSVSTDTRNMLTHLGSFDDIVERAITTANPDRNKVLQNVGERLRKMTATGVDRPYLEAAYKPFMKAYKLTYEELLRVGVEDPVVR